MYKLTVAFVGNALIASCSTDKPTSSSARAQKIAENIGIGFFKGVQTAVDPLHLCEMWDQVLRTPEAVALVQEAEDLGQDAIHSAKQDLFAAFKARLPDSLKRMLTSNRLAGHENKSLVNEPNIRCNSLLQQLTDEVTDETKADDSPIATEQLSQADSQHIAMEDEVENMEIEAEGLNFFGNSAEDQTSYDSDNLDSLSYKGMVSSEEPITPAYARRKEYLNINPNRYEAV